MEEFGTRLRYYRRRRRLTQSQLASQVGVAAAYVSQIESALRVPSLKVARRFASSLGVDLPTLLGSENATVSTDELSDSQKLEVLRRMIRAVEFDQEHRPHRIDLEIYWGSPGIVIAEDEQAAVRTFIFPEEPVGESPDTFHFHPGQEMVYCAVGRVHIVVNGRRRTLTVGEVFTFDSSMPHSVWGEKGAVAVSTVTPPLRSANYERGPANWNESIQLVETNGSSLKLRHGTG
jgi:transcriptional regulator with XRE-family HTH domain